MEKINWFKSKHNQIFNPSNYFIFFLFEWASLVRNIIALFKSDEFKFKVCIVFVFKFYFFLILCKRKAWDEKKTLASMACLHQIYWIFFKLCKSIADYWMQKVWQMISIDNEIEKDLEKTISTMTQTHKHALKWIFFLLWKTFNQSKNRMEQVLHVWVHFRIPNIYKSIT